MREARGEPEASLLFSGAFPFAEEERSTSLQRRVRFSLAVSFPAMTALSHQRQPSRLFTGVPTPFQYIQPRFDAASGWFLFAASLMRSKAWSSSRS